VATRGARAAHRRSRPLIGVSPVSAADARPLITAFRSTLRDLGYLEGHNLTIAVRYGEGAPERMAPPARELVAVNPDVLVVGAQSGISAVSNATRTIPIVVVTLEDPVKAGLAQSIARPGGNITGMWTLGGDTLAGKGLDFLKLAVPDLTRVGALLNPNGPIGARSPDPQTAEDRQMCQFNGGSSRRACGQIDSCRLPHDLHGPHSSHSNMKTSRDRPGIEMGD
jgi:putative tryptophan/tyrosine transport system substrate-binding protein